MKYRENALGYEDYRRLRESVGWTNYSREQTVKALSGSLYTVTAADGERVVGMGRLIGDGLYNVIVDVVVEPPYQGKGLGGKLVDLLLERVKRETPRGGHSSVQLIAAVGKEPFYEKRGFQRIPNEACGSGMRMVVHKGG